MLNSSLSKHLQFDFKKTNKIGQRHVRKYTSSKSNATFRETVEAVELFKKRRQKSQVTLLFLEREWMKEDRK
jgi:hypothetical protein